MSKLSQSGDHENKCKVSGDIHVRGEIDANLPTNLIEQYKAARNEITPRDNLRLAIEILTLVAIVIYAGLTWWQARSSQRSANAAVAAVGQAHTQFVQDQRPYVWQTPKTTSSPIFHEKPGDPSQGQIIWDWHMTNYGKTPANNVTFTQEMKLSPADYVPSYGETGKDIGNPQAPTGDTFDTVISSPMKTTDFKRLLAINEGISIRIRIWYTDVEGTAYESSICLTRTNYGSIVYCKEGNYIH